GSFEPSRRADPPHHEQLSRSAHGVRDEPFLSGGDASNAVRVRSAGSDANGLTGGGVTAERGEAIEPGRAGGLGAGVRIRNLTKRYGGALAVDGISLDVAPGEFMTLLGPSGSGKTTTMMAVAGFVEDYEGEIRIADRVIDALPAHRRNVGVL